MNSSSRHYLNSWPRNTTTAPPQATILTCCTKGRRRRRSGVAKATCAPAGTLRVTPQVTVPTPLGVQRENSIMEGCKCSIFVDDARNVCKETFSCSLPLWALDGLSQASLGVLTLQDKTGLCSAPTEVNLGDEPEITPVRQKLGDPFFFFQLNWKDFFPPFLISF